MARLTTAQGTHHMVAREMIAPGGDGFTGPAVERLAQFEDAYEHLRAEQTEIAHKLEDLRAQGKERTVQFKELLGRKLINAQILLFFETRGLG